MNLVRYQLRFLAWSLLCCAVHAGGGARVAAGDEPLPDAAVQFMPLYESSPLMSLVRAEDNSAPVLLDEQYAHEPDLSDWDVLLLPEGLIYRPYLANPKESRISGQFVKVAHDGWVCDSTLGARIGLLRIGTGDAVRPRGLQLDAEGSGQFRCDLAEDYDLRSADYRLGLPLTLGSERRQWKFGYYHLNSQLADDFLQAHPGTPAATQSRDTLVLGYSRYLLDALRIYGEAGWAFRSVVSKPWEFQLGLDCAPRRATGRHGAPFFALNAHLREELAYSGGFTFQAGWAWRSDMTAKLLRTGLQYYDGASPQYAFLHQHEQQLGLGVWYDF